MCAAAVIVSANSDIADPPRDCATVGRRAQSESHRRPAARAMDPCYAISRITP
jgi:hypothetical protein